MSKSGSIVLALLATLCTACGGPQLTCDSPQLYQAAIEVDKVRSPDGLDTLVAGKEMDIPRASPQDPRPAGSPCLDLPPTMQGSRLNSTRERMSQSEDDDDADAETDDETGTNDGSPNDGNPDDEG